MRKKANGHTNGFLSALAAPPGGTNPFRTLKNAVPGLDPVGGVSDGNRAFAGFDLRPQLASSPPIRMTISGTLA